MEGEEEEAISESERKGNEETISKIANQTNYFVSCLEHI